jgi:hypothetical protein
VYLNTDCVRFLGCQPIQSSSCCVLQVRIIAVGYPTDELTKLSARSAIGALLDTVIYPVIFFQVLSLECAFAGVQCVKGWQSVAHFFDRCWRTAGRAGKLFAGLSAN